MLYVIIDITRGEFMKRSALRNISADIRTALAEFFGSSYSPCAFEAFLRGAALEYMAENSLLLPNDTICLHELFPQIFITDDGDPVTECAVIKVRSCLRDIPSELWEGNVQLIGQLYQYYNSDRKNKALSGLKKNKKVDADSLPAATQIFTPEWIVRYMTENTLGRIFSEGCGYDIPGMDYHIPFVHPALKRETEEITLLDPCVGSGNILAYAFDIFMKVYLAKGVSAEKAAEQVLARHIFGLDIDSCVCRIARFVLIMKAAQYHKDIIYSGISPQIYDTEGIFCGENSFSRQFSDSEIFGSLIRPYIPPEEGSTKAVAVYRLLTRRYSAVVTNPPYMSSANMNSRLLSFIKENYPEQRADLFSAFIQRCCELTEDGGYMGFFTPYVWMFIQSYEKLRRMLFNEKTPETLIQLEYSAFDEATVPVCAFTLRNGKYDAKGIYIRLTAFRGGLEVQRQKLLEAIADRNCGYVYEASADDFGKIPHSPAAYWISDRVREIYGKYPALGSISAPRKGNSTSDNDRFLRLWYEVDMAHINIGSRCIVREKTLDKRWFPYNKGGGYRKWYGFDDYIIDWYDDAAEIRAVPTAVIANYRYFTKEGLTWSTLTSGRFSIRQFGEGYIFDNGGCCIFELGEKKWFICGLLNSKVFAYIFGQLNPTLNFQSGEVAKFPVVFEPSQEADRLVEECIAISKAEYDSFETSRGFRRHPLI